MNPRSHIAALFIASLILATFPATAPADYTYTISWDRSRARKLVDEVVALAAAHGDTQKGRAEIQGALARHTKVPPGNRAEVAEALLGEAMAGARAKTREEELSVTKGRLRGEELALRQSHQKRHDALMAARTQYERLTEAEGWLSRIRSGTLEAKYGTQNGVEVAIPYIEFYNRITGERRFSEDIPSAEREIQGMADAYRSEYERLLRDAGYTSSDTSARAVAAFFDPLYVEHQRQLDRILADQKAPALGVEEARRDYEEATAALLLVCDAILHDGIYLSDLTVEQGRSIATVSGVIVSSHDTPIDSVTLEFGVFDGAVRVSRELEFLNNVAPLEPTQFRMIITHDFDRIELLSMKVHP